MKLLHTILGTAAIGAFAFSAAATAGTLEDVKARGVLNCIVNTGLPGFS